MNRPSWKNYTSVDEYVNDLEEYVDYLEDLDSSEDQGFAEFFDQYHLISGKPKTDKQAALKYWKKLKAKEKILAYDNIKPYCDSVSEVRYIKKARTYLADKNFNDEFKKVIDVIPGYERRSSYD